MIIIDCEQNSEEWFDARLGIPSASKFGDILTTKGVPSKSAEKYMYKLAGEIVKGEREDGYTNANMERGHEREAESRETYEFINGVKVQQVGFCLINEQKECGCSPDGLVGEDGGFETKDANSVVHLDRLEHGWTGSPYIQQVQGSLYVTGRKWWDLVSYSRGFKPLIIRFERDEEFIKKLAIELRLFNNNLKDVVKKYSV